MPVVSSIFLIASLFLAVIFGPLTQPWSWGPAMLALGFSVIAACPSWWSRQKSPSDLGTIVLASIAAAWFAIRACSSPVAEFGQADLLLICSGVGAFISVRAISENRRAEQVLTWGIALLLLANIVVVGMQLRDPKFSPMFPENLSPGNTIGWFGHYNEAANFFIVSSMIVAAAGLFGRQTRFARVILAFIAIAGIVCIWFTHSRGGIFGAAAALGVFAGAALMLGKKRGARWFGPALIAIPVIGLGIGMFLFMGWQSAQDAHSNGNPTQDLSALLDNNCRLYILGMAFSCFYLHPLIGGGSRSFSWECFRFAIGKEQGDLLTHKPEFVHNELVQSFVDYGLVGGALILALLFTIIVISVVGILFDDAESSSENNRDAWRIGGFAGVVGMLVQSSFSFVFHLIPGILFLGICLAQMTSKTTLKGLWKRELGSRFLLVLASLACCVVLIPMGWKGLRVTRTLWPTYYGSQHLASPETKIDALTAAIQIWPQTEFYLHRAINTQKLSGVMKEPLDIDRIQSVLGDCDHGADLNPYNPEFPLSRANFLSEIRRDDEAEQAYALGIQLQGGMEPAFRGHLLFATHLLRKGIREHEAKTPDIALKSIDLAAQEIDAAVDLMHWMLPDIYKLRLTIYEALGAAREATGDNLGALDAYQSAAKFLNGARVNYRIGLLYGKMGKEQWKSRHAPEAMRDFMMAKAITAATTTLPTGVTPLQRADYLNYLEKAIAFLKGAKVQPASDP
jgi:O-antigen ligase/tetratricopeptide (TPR) repeat protein